MRSTFLLTKKVARDIKANIVQYIAIILIATLAISLFLGLATSYHSLDNRVNKLYQNGNVADLDLLARKFSDSDFEKISKLDSLKESAIEKRTLLPLNISAEKKAGQTKDENLDYNYSLILNKNNQLNKITNYYDHNGTDITNQYFNEPPKEGVFLPRSVKKVKIGTKLNLKMSYSIILSLLANKGLQFEMVNNEYTGRIGSYKDKDFIPYEIDLGNNRKFDFSKTSFDILNYSLFGNNLEDIKGNTIEEKNTNNIISYDNYLNLIKKINNANEYINLESTFLGYVDSPESVEKNSKQRKAFIDKDYFITLLINHLKMEYKKELALISELASITNNKPLLSNSHDILSEYYNDSFFTTGALKKIKMGYSVLTIDKQNIIVNFFNNLNNLNQTLNNYYNEVLIKLKNKKNLKVIQNEINDPEILKLENKLLLNQSLEQSETNKSIQSDVIQSQQLMLVFPIIFFLVAFLMIISTSIQMVIKERTQIGTLKALGISNHKIYRNYIMRNVLIISIGTIIGLISGPLTLPHVVNQKYKLLYNLPKLEIIFPWLEAITLLTAFYLLISLIIFFIVRAEVKLMPAKSMRPKAPEINLIIKPKKVKGNKIPLKMAMRNIRINKFRSFMTVIGVMGTVALLLVGLGIQDTLDYGINYDISRYYKSDYAIQYKLGHHELVEKLRQMPEVASVEEYYTFPALLKNTNNNLTTQSFALGFMKNSQFYSPDNGFELMPGECNISEKVATNLGLKEGNEVRFNSIDNREFKFKIKRIYKTFFVQGIIFNFQDLYNDPVLGDISGITQHCYLNLKDNSPKNVKTFTDKLYTFPEVTDVYTRDTTKNLINNVMSTIKVATYTILFFAIALAVVVLYNLSQLNLSARKRELATLKVLGFNNQEVAKSLLYEMLFLTVIGIILGLLLGLPTLYLILKINETPIISYLYHITWESYMLAGSAVLLTAFLLMQYISLKNKKIDMISMLKSVE